MLLFFLIWLLYLIIGVFYLYTLVNSKNKHKEYNIIGSLVIITIWPFMLINNLIKWIL